MSRHYLLTDKFNQNKGHHIIIEDDGRMFYNQAINIPRHAGTKQSVPGHAEWFDFYDQDEPVNHGGRHGYQEYIDRARRTWETERPLVVGDVFGDWFNQGEREVEVLAVVDDRALASYTMPAGRSFLAIYDRTARKWIRAQAVRSLPKKWIAALGAGMYEDLTQ